MERDFSKLTFTIVFQLCIDLRAEDELAR